MSRSTTYMWITDAAKKYIGENAAIYPKEWVDKFGNKQINYRPLEKEIGKCGMCDEEKIFAYKMKDDTWAEEFVQQTVYHSGPVVFMGLRHGDKEFLWDEKEINEY